MNIGCHWNKINSSTSAFFRQVRSPISKPICCLFIKLHINQSHVTLSRIVMLIGFYFAWAYDHRWLAFALMLTAWLLDCVDGDLSRMLDNENEVGKFEDAWADNFACLIFPLALIQSGQLIGILGALFIFGAFADYWLTGRPDKLDYQNANLVFKPRGDLWLRLTRKIIAILLYIFIFFKVDIFNYAYGVMTLGLCLAVAFNYLQIIRSRLKI